MPSSIAEARRSAARAPDKFEQLDRDFFEKVRQEYLRRAEDDAARFRVIDSNQPKEEIWNLIKEISLSI